MNCGYDFLELFKYSNSYYRSNTVLQKNNIYRRKNVSKVILMAFLTSISILGSSQPLNRVNSSIKTIVIDPGHGGKDPGCVGLHSKEKDVALKIALELGKYLEDSLPDIQVFYTRKDDRFIELWQRANLANKKHADLFISIHCNAHTNKAINGFETYVMGLEKTKANLLVSKRENETIKMESGYLDQPAYKNVKSNSPESHIILSMQQNAFLERSINLASLVQEKTKDKGNLLDLGVKQANFIVLWKTTMPSILVETGFLTNVKNEDYLNSEKGEIESAYNIFEAVKDYKLRLEQINN
jgi:N-acetylmuramoyl-L-alanine amidase